MESVWFEIFHRPEDRAVFQDTRPAWHGCMREWHMAAGSIRVFSLCTLWDFCREIRLQESSGCSGPGGIFRKNSALS